MPGLVLVARNSVKTSDSVSFVYLNTYLLQSVQVTVFILINPLLNVLTIKLRYNHVRGAWLKQPQHAYICLAFNFLFFLLCQPFECNYSIWWQTVCIDITARSKMTDFPIHGVQSMGRCDIMVFLPEFVVCFLEKSLFPRNDLKGKSSEVQGQMLVMSKRLTLSVLWQTQAYSWAGSLVSRGCKSTLLRTHTPVCTQSWEWLAVERCSMG